MSVTSGFFNSIGNDRRYNAEQMSAIFDGIINDGVLINIGTVFGVSAAGGNVITVGAGRAWFNSTWLLNDTLLPLTIPTSEVLLDRIDAVVIEIDRTTAIRSGNIKIIKGTPASTPQKPAMVKTDYIHQYPLAYITVKSQSTAIVQANIENRIGTSDCPYVTSVLKSTNIDNLIAQWQDEWENWSENEQDNFYEWIDSLKDVINANAAANLAHQIYQINNVILVTLPASGWLGTAAPYSQTVVVQDATDKSEATVVSALADGAPAATQLAYNKAFSIIVSGTAAFTNKAATFKVYKKPTTDITIGLKGVGASIDDAESSLSTGSMALPNVYITAEYLDDWIDKSDERLVNISFNGSTKFQYYAKMKPQGTSSLNYPKKNFKIKLYTDASLSTKQKVNLKSGWGSHADYTLKADYVDPTHMCNVTGAQLGADMQTTYDILPDTPHRGLIDGFPAMVWMNGEQYGIYNVTIPKSDWQFSLDNDNPNHILLGCESQIGSGAFKALATFDEWTVEAGPEDANTLTKFNRMVGFVKDSTNAEFRQNAHNYLNIQACINYYLFAYYSTAIDNLAKNMLMVTYDGLIWTPSLYDLDSLWGVQFDGVQELSPYRLCPSEYECPDSILWTKILTNFPQEICDTFENLRAILNPNNVIGKQSKYIYGIDMRFYAIDSAIWTESSNKIHGLVQTGKNLNMRDPYMEYMIHSMALTPSIYDARKSYEITAPFVGDGTASFLNTKHRPFKNTAHGFTIIAKLAIPSIDSGALVYFGCFHDADPYYGLLCRINAWESFSTLGVSVGPNYGVSKALTAGQDVIISITKVGPFYTVVIDGQILLNTFKLTEIPSMSKELVIAGNMNETGTVVNLSAVTVKKFELYNKALTARAISDITTSW